MKKFTSKELSDIASERYSMYGLQEKLGRTEEEIEWAIKEFDIEFKVLRYKKWTIEEDSILAEMRARRCKVPEISKALGRASQPIRMRIKQLGLPKLRESGWTKEMDDVIILSNMIGKSFGTIARKLKRSKKEVSERFYKITE
ncbi:MAG: hypothetical protein ACRC45_00585 [Cetobacterium sp.]